ncbi:MAG: carboxypeptidase regulatory-like domain-containing protein, partial [Deltaproteobacteria bacterium]|nr:carboxypeptidase regulatory-like domain-containing protein [Deltaproteobacteria bacterium]
SGGDFDASVDEGEYVVASVRRNPGNAKYGPPDEGEQVYLSERVQVRSGETLDLGSQRGKAHVTGAETDLATIQGKLLDSSGKPFRNAFVVAFPGGYLSKRTKGDGQFTLNLPKGGEYKIIARDTYRGFT